MWSCLSTAPMYLQQEAKLEYPGGSTFMQNCAKKASSSLTRCSQPQAVGWSTVQACPPHACSTWWLFLGHGSCSEKAWASSLSKSFLLAAPEERFYGVGWCCVHERGPALSGSVYLSGPALVLTYASEQNESCKQPVTKANNFSTCVRRVGSDSSSLCHG